MANIDALYARILNELKRPGLTSEVRLAVADAIEYYSTYRLWFLEETKTITTVAGQAAYDIPSDVREVLDLSITIGSQKWSMGTPWTYDQYLSAALDTTLNTGQPSNWAPWESSFYLYTAPDAEYTLTLSYIENLGVPDDGDENAWTNDGEPLIRARAKWDLLTNVVRAYDEASIQGGLDGTGGICARWLARLQKRTQGYGRPRGIVASTW